jgi:putative membrane protein
MRYGGWQKMDQRDAVALLLVWLSNCVALFIAALVIPAIGYHHRLGTLLLAGLVLGVVNFLLRPLALALALPLVIFTLGIGLLLVNGFMLWVTSKIVTGLHVGHFWSIVGGALVIWLVNLALRPWTGTRGPIARRGPQLRPFGR